MWFRSENWIPFPFHEGVFGAKMELESRSEGSPLSKTFQQAVQPGGSVSESGSRNRLGRKKDSEWVFRPLKLKFKVKELEHLYNNAVYRQRQALLLGACVLMSILSLLVLLVYLGTRKVGLEFRNCILRIPCTRHPQ